MAADNLSNINAALATTFASKMVRAWNRLSVTLQEMNFVSGGGQGGGKQVGWDAQFTGATAASFAEGSDIGAGEYSHDVELPAVLPWGQYRAAFQLSNLEMNAAYGNIGNAAELERILEERLIGAVTKITQKMNQDTIAGTGVDGNGNPTIIGIVPAVAASGTYAGISKSTYPEWAGNVNANGGIARPLSFDLLAKAEQAQYVASGMSPEVLIVTPGVRTKYEGLFQAVFRSMSDNQGAIKSFNGSTDDLFWRGRPVVREKDLATGYVMGIRPSDMYMHMLPWSPVDDGVPIRMKDLLSSNGGSMQNQLGKFVNVYPLGRTGSSVKFVAEIYCQLRVARPNEHFVLQDVNEI